MAIERFRSWLISLSLIWRNQSSANFYPLGSMAISCSRYGIGETIPLKGYLIISLPYLFFQIYVSCMYSDLILHSIIYKTYHLDPPNHICSHRSSHVLELHLHTQRLSPCHCTGSDEDSTPSGRCHPNKRQVKSKSLTSQCQDCCY